MLSNKGKDLGLFFFKTSEILLTFPEVAEEN